MKGKELYAVVKFALISLVVLPILPNKNYSPLDVPGLGDLLVGLNVDVSFLSQLNVFNFYHIWLMVVFIAAINFVGYFLVKMVGSKKGYGVLGFVGGLVSSTAVTLSMAGESKKQKVFSPFILATIIAASAITLVGVFATLSFGPLSDALILGKTVFGWFDYLSANILLPLGAIFIVLFVGWYLGKKSVADEITNQGELKGRLLNVFIVIVKFIAPIAITLVFIYGLGLIG